MTVVCILTETAWLGLAVCINPSWFGTLRNHQARSSDLKIPFQSCRIGQGGFCAADG